MGKSHFWLVLNGLLLTWVLLKIFSPILPPWFEVGPRPKSDHVKEDR